MPNPFDQFDNASAPGGRITVGGPAPRLPSPQTLSQAESDDLTVRDKTYNVQSKPVYDRATAFDKVRDGVRQDKRLLKYEEAIPVFVSALKSPGNSAGDMMLVNSFAKTMDPVTGVQQREGDQIAGAQPALDQIKAQLLKQFGEDGYGNFTPEGRQKLRNTLVVRMELIAKQYRQARAEHKQYIKSLNLPDADIDAILGPFAGDPYRDDVRAYDAKIRGEKPPASPDGKINFHSNADKPPRLPEGAKGMAYDPASDSWTITYQDGTTEGGAPPLEVDVVGGRISPEQQSRIDARSDGRGQATVHGAADTITFGALDELSAGADAFAGALQGKGSIDQLYNDNLLGERAYRDELKEKHPGYYIGGQVLGGFALPMGQINSLGGLAKAGAGYGAAYGAGSSDGSIGDRAINALLGGGAGAATAGAIGVTGRGIRAGVAAAGRKIAGPTTPEQMAILKAADEERVPINAGDVYEGAQNTISTLETIPGSSGPVRSGIGAGRDAIEARVGALGRGGTARENMGDGVLDAGQRFVERADDQAGRLYDRARRAAGDTPITPNASAAVTKALLQAEEAVPGGTKAGAIIKRYADALESGKPITIDGARAMRSELLSTLRTDGGLSKGKATHITNKIMKAVNNDIEVSLTAAGRKGAVRAYKMADRFYAETREEIDRVTEKFIGTEANPKSAETALLAMRNAANPKGGNAKALSAMLARLSPDERKDYAATLVEHLGRKSPEEPFSPSTFITQIRLLSPQARRIIFGADGERSIQNLITISNAKNASVQRLNNSRSGQVVNYRSVISNLIFGIPGGAAIAGAASGVIGSVGAVVGAGISAVGIASSRAFAKALMNDEFVRTIAQAPASSSSKAINAHIGRLRKVAAKDPNVRSVVEGLERKLLEYANDNVSKAGQVAASPNERPEQNR